LVELDRLKANDENDEKTKIVAINPENKNTKFIERNLIGI